MFDSSPFPDSMNAAVVHDLGAPPAPRPFPRPVAEASEVLVTVRAAAIHQLVKTIARGAHLAGASAVPFVAGVDGVGALPDGQRVYFGLPRPPYGTMAEVCPAPRAMCFPLPETADDVFVAGAMNPLLSSWMALVRRAELVAGETVLVFGATGTAGQLAVQVARRLGAGRVLAVGRDEGALARLRDLGAEIVSLRSASWQDELAAEPVDVVLDYLWGAPTEALVEALTRAPRGHSALVQRSRRRRLRLVDVGEMAGRTASLAASMLRAADLTIVGSGGGSVSGAEYAVAIPELLALVASGSFQLDVERVPLADVEAAWTRATRARLVVCP